MFTDSRTRKAIASRAFKSCMNQTFIRHIWNCQIYQVEHFLKVNAVEEGDPGA
jgi:hypothetical protein